MNLRDTLLAGDFVGTSNNTSFENINEEFLEFQIAQEAFNDITLEAREIERLQEVAVGLDNLNKVCGFIKNASPVELGLVETATTLALAGTDIKCEQILPSLESYKGTDFSTEAIGKFAINIWKAINKMVKRQWTNVIRFYNSIFRSIPKLRKSAEDLKLRADAVKEKNLTGDKVEMGNASQTLSRDYDAIKSLSELKDAFDVYGQFSTTLLSEYTGLLVQRGEIIRTKLDDSTISTADSIVDIAKLMVIPKNPLKEVLNKSSFKLTNSELAKDERYNAASSYMNPAGLKLFQSKYFVTDLVTDKDIDKMLSDNGFKGLEGDEKIGVANDALEFVTKSKTEIVMAYSSSKKPKMPKKESAEPINCYDVQTVADSILAICDSVEINSSTDNFKEIEKVGDTIEKATGKMASGVDKDEIKTGSMATAWRLIAGLNSAWVTMSTKPQSQWTNHVFAVSRAAIDVCNKSLSLYS